MRIQHSTGWAAIFCNAIHPGTDHRTRDDQDKMIAYYWEANSTKAQTESLTRKRMSTFDGRRCESGVYRKVPYMQAIERTGRLDIKKANQRHRSRLVPRSSITELTKLCTWRTN